MAKKVPDKYKERYKCVDFAESMEKLMRKEGVSGERISFNSSSGHVYSIKDGEISKNGYHEAIKINGKIYDNMNPDGIVYDKWAYDLGISEVPSEFIFNVPIPIG